MIKKIFGFVDSIKNGYAVIKCDKIGYQVFFNEVSLGNLVKKENGEIEIYTYTYVREDQLSLFGFLEESELDMFEMLISISGIGPKAALGILNIADPKTIKTAIVSEDCSILTKVSGIGKKTAERVVLELKNKIDQLPDVDSEEIQVDQEVIEALLAMGYSISEAREAVKIVPRDIEDVSDKIKFALKAMRK